MHKYLIDGKNYKGQVIAFMGEDGKSIYSGKTTEEYVKDNPDAICVSEDEWYEKYHKPFLENLSGNWRDISEKMAEDVFECLPPFVKEMNNGDMICFMNPEADQGHLHDHYVKSCGKWKSALMSKFATASEIAESFNKSINK